MKKQLFRFLLLTILTTFLAAGCKTTVTPKIENTLKSVSLVKDTIGHDPALIRDMFDKYNAAVAEIGYPDAGYSFWVIQEDTSEIKYLFEGSWPDQETYDMIHEHPLYKEVGESTKGTLEGLVAASYYRFIKEE